MPPIVAPVARAIGYDWAYWRGNLDVPTTRPAATFPPPQGMVPSPPPAWANPTPTPAQPVQIALGGLGLTGDDHTVYETLKASHGALSARHAYKIIADTQTFSVRRTEAALTRLVATGHARQIGTTYKATT